ncbi:pyrroloquinoline quinone biosynthesis protein PqqE [Phytohabitans sp. LJ34]|uniref:pyrroloquinoline quinone biosynthesis protein PqqE n=1 Tax=Phytohabitans sp. LJ34 TaxID=3452217 RepID=UPI003F88D026
MSAVDAADRPGLRPGVRLTYDPVRDQHALLYPEGVLLLNETAAEVLARCGGGTVAEIAARLSEEFDGVPVDDVAALLDDLVRRRLVTVSGDGRPVQPLAAPPAEWTPPREPVPAGMLAELTYRCPLHCTYCSNPTTPSDRPEMSTEDWSRVLDQARSLGVLQVHFSGGEPLLRADLAALVARAHRLGLYSNLITSGIPFDDKAMGSLAAAGLDHVQLSIQDADPAAGDAVAGLRAHDRKRAAAALVRRYGLPLTVNVVLHAGNVDRLAAIADLAVELGADRLELAHTQFYGWAWRNRAALLPTAEQLARAGAAAAGVKERYGDRVEIVYVAADYHGTRPKPCMQGWGRRQLVVAPDGSVLPCLSAAQLPGLGVVDARTADLAWIWYESPAFNRFRGTGWMPAPCRDCALREVDFGGCRCQAYQLLGDAALTDPACDLSPHHGVLTDLMTGAGERAAAVPRRLR